MSVRLALSLLPCLFACQTAAPRVPNDLEDLVHAWQEQTGANEKPRQHVLRLTGGRYPFPKV